MRILLKRLTLSACLWALLLPVYPAAPSGSFENVRDSIIDMIWEAKDDINKGDFYSGDRKLEAITEYFGKVKAEHQADASVIRELEFEIQNAIAWNKTLIKQYSLAETIYKQLVESTPDSCHLDLSSVYVGMSSMYGMQKMWDLSEIYAIKALEEAQLTNDNQAAFYAQSNLGDIYMETEQYEKALEKYLEVRRLSVVLGRSEAISAGNLAIVYHKLNKTGLAEQYFVESLALSKEASPVVYSLVLPGYCELLIDQGRKKEAGKLILEAIADERYTQMSEYNLKYLALLSRVYPQNSTPPLLLIPGIVLLLAGILFFLLKVRKQNSIIKQLQQDNQTLSDKIEQTENISTGTGDTNEQLKNDKVMQLIGLVESYPVISQLLNKIKVNPDNKSEVLSAVKELNTILLPLLSENFENELSYYIEQENLLFYDSLKQKHPNLSITDLRLCTLIKMGMHTKEIAVITNKSVRGIESAKFRLRKKMNIDSSTDIFDFLADI